MPLITSNLSAPAKRAEVTIEQTSRFVQSTESFLHRRHDELTDQAGTQEYLDAFGDKAAQSLALYNALRDLVVAAKGSTTAPPIDSAVFVSNPDGTVTFVGNAQ